jgi:hypothetical protein
VHKSSTSQEYDADGKFTCYRHVETTYVRGRKKTVSTCDSEL